MSGAAEPHPASNPCLRCGACCASFRVDFALDEWAAAGGSVPEALAEPIGSGGTCRMLGTDRQPPRCAALLGSIGRHTRCAIHEWRPSPCREFEPGSDACAAARRRHALAPL